MAQMAKSGNGFNPFKYAYDCSSLLRNAVLPTDVIIDFEDNSNLTTMASMFLNTSGVKNLIIKNLTSDKTNLAMNGFLYISPHIQTLTFDNCNFAPSTLESFCRSCGELTTINGEIDCSNCKAGNALGFWFNSTNKISDFRIKRNTIGMSPTSNWGTATTWSNASYVSLGNGLNPNFTGTFTLTAAQKAVCSTIMGVVTDGVFVEADGGSVSLTDFITNTKGWTLA